MVGHGHTKETVELLNINSIHLNSLFDGKSGSYQRNRGAVKVNFIYFNILFDGRPRSYQRNRWVVKFKLYTFNHPFRW